jgi:predicted CoA-binding protein
LVGAETTFDNPTTDELRAIYADTETIAVVGASSSREKAAHTVPEYLQSMGYRIIPVSPRGGELFGEPVVASLADVAAPVDVVQVFRPSDEVPRIARDAAAIGAKVLWMQPGIVSAEGAEIARRHGMEVAMDICMRATHLLLGLGPRHPAAGSS